MYRRSYFDMVPRNSMFVVGLARRNADRVAITSSKSCLGFSGDMLSPIARGAHIIRRHPYREKGVARLPFIKALRGAHRLRHHPYRGAGIARLFLLPRHCEELLEQAATPTIQGALLAFLLSRHREELID